MADRKLPELRTRIRLDTSDLDKADSRIAKFTRNFSDPRAMAGYQARLQGIGDKADEVGSKLTRNLTLPVVAASAVSVKMAQDFNKSFTTMTSLAGVTADEVAGLKEEVKDLAKETGRSPQELAEALYFIRSAGLDGAEAMDALEASARGAAIGLGETSAVADAATSAVNAYGFENLTASEAVDQLAAAVAEGKGEAAAFAPQIGQILPLAKALGVEFSEVAGAMAYFTKTGTPVAQAATMVQGVLQKIIAPSQQAKEAFEKYGITLEELQSTVSNQGLLSGIELLNRKVGGNREVLARIFDDVEGRNAVFGFLNNSEDAAEVLDKVANSAETVAQAFARVQGTDEFQAQQAITDLQVAAIELGQTLIPIVTDLANGISGIVNAFGELPQPVQTGILSLVAFGAVLGPIAKGLSLTTSGVSLLLKAASSKSLDGFRLGLMGVGTEGAGAAAKVGGLLNAIGPTGVAAGVAGIGLLTYAFTEVQQSAADAQANVDSLVAALEAGDTPAEAIGKKIAATLNDAEGGFKGLGGSSRELQADLDAAGVSITELRDALLGGDKAFAAFIDSIRAKGEESGNPVAFEVLIGNLERFRSEADRSKATFQGQQDDLATLGVETDKAASSTDGLASSQSGLADDTDDANAELEKQADAARALFDAHRNVTDTADALKDAQDELADAQRAAAPGSEENRRALEAVADAERAVQDAQRQSADAQRGLTEARKEAAENLEDLALAASGAQVDEAGAAVALERAKSDLLKAKTPLDRAEAEQRIREAEQALAEAKDKTGDTAAALADARAKGIEGSDAVVAAQQRITDARNAERDAQGRLADATESAAKVRADAADKVREASEKLTDAELDHIDAQAEVVELTDGSAASTDVLIEKLSAFAATLDPNSPLRRNLADYIADLKELQGIENPAPTGGGVGSLGSSAPPGAVNAERLLSGGSLRIPDLPSATAVVPPAAGSDVRTPSRGNVKIEIPVTVLGQPDAATIAKFREVATEAAETALRKVTL